MTYSQDLILLLAGIAAGYINVLAGGGSMLTMPVMVLMGLPAPVANGTNRIAILAQSITSVAVFWRKGLSEFKLSISLALCTLPGAWLGAHSGVKLEGVWFNRLLALVMLIIMFVMMFERRLVSNDITKDNQPQRIWLTHGLMLVVGFYGGLLQVGVGFLIMAILHRVMGLDLIRVNVHKVFLVFPFTVLSLVIFATNTGVLWRTGIFLAVGMGVGGWLGAHMMIRKGERLIKIAFNLALLALIVKLLFFS